MLEQRAQTLWSDWSNAAAQPRSEPPAAITEDVSGYLRSVARMLQADEALLTLHVEAGGGDGLQVAATGSTLPLSSHAQLAALVAPKGGTHGWSVPSIDPEWTTCMLDQRSWHVLRLPIWSRRARTGAVLNMLFRTASLADRSRTVAKLDMLRPVIEPYFRLWQRSRLQEREAGGFRGALDSIELGVMLVDRSSRIIFANKSAGAVLEAGDPLRRVGESLTASDVRQAVPLQVALSHAIADNNDGKAAAAGGRRASIVSIKSQRLGRSLVLSVVPAEEHAAQQGDVAAIVYVVDPRVDTTKQLQPVCALFGLSPVETRLVCLLTAGQTLQDAAKAMRIKDQTARSYLKQIFSKTDTRRQADLVRVMLCSLLRTERTIEPVSLKATD